MRKKISWRCAGRVIRGSMRSGETAGTDMGMADDELPEGIRLFARNYEKCESNAMSFACENGMRAAGVGTSTHTRDVFQRDGGAGRISVRSASGNGGALYAQKPEFKWGIAGPIDSYSAGRHFDPHQRTIRFSRNCESVLAAAPGSSDRRRPGMNVDMR